MINLHLSKPLDLDKPLTKGKKYVFRYFNIFYTGFYIDNLGLEDSPRIIFLCNIRNLMNNSIVDNLFFDRKLIILYERILQKDFIQQTMEEKSLKLILRKIIGDEHFTHYLFEDIKIDHEIIDENINDTKIDETSPHEMILRRKYIHGPILIVIVSVIIITKIIITITKCIFNIFKYTVRTLNNYIN